MSRQRTGSCSCRDRQATVRLTNSVAPAGRCARASVATVDSRSTDEGSDLHAARPVEAGYVDVGGGGSDFTWQALAGANYAISPTMTAKFGYRYLKVDYHRDNFLYDVATGGPNAGIGLRF